MNIQEKLLSMRDLSYKSFHQKLMPTVDWDTVIGIRVPLIRKLAKELKNTPEAKLFLDSLPHRYYEENNLHACLLEGIRQYDNCMAKVKEFLPHINNWATCDMLSPKIFQKHLPQLQKECFLFLESGHPYTVRFGIKMLMDHFLEEHFSEEYPERIAQIQSEEYYVNMMIAWYFATALAKQYEAVLPYLEEQRLPFFVHNKTIQKAVESRRISPHIKEYLKALRRVK